MDWLANYSPAGFTNEPTPRSQLLPLDVARLGHMKPNGQSIILHKATAEASITFTHL